jgi:hypothetical protein
MLIHPSRTGQSANASFWRASENVASANTSFRRASGGTSQRPARRRDGDFAAASFDNQVAAKSRPKFFKFICGHPCPHAKV